MDPGQAQAGQHDRGAPTSAISGHQYRLPAIDYGNEPSSSPYLVWAASFTDFALVLIVGAAAFAYQIFSKKLLHLNHIS
jgi:hypothetical protein